VIVYLEQVMKFASTIADYHSVRAIRAPRHGEEEKDVMKKCGRNLLQVRNKTALRKYGQRDL
jgi:3-deoxy-D-manno-octulosonic-acid transferase